MNVMIYCRVFPSNKLVGQSDKFEAQKSRCWAYARSFGWTVTHRFADEGRGLFSSPLPRFEAMLSRIRECDHEIVVMADHIGRFGHDQASINHNIKQIKNAGASISIVSQSRFMT